MIKTDHIVKAFDGKTVLDGLTLTFEENRCTVFMGASGTGKTTLMNILSGLMPPDSGTVTGLDGIKKSFVFQENRLLESSENNVKNQ